MIEAATALLDEIRASPTDWEPRDLVGTLLAGLLNQVRRAAVLDWGDGWNWHPPALSAVPPADERRAETTHPPRRDPLVQFIDPMDEHLYETCTHPECDDNPMPGATTCKKHFE